MAYTAKNKSGYKKAHTIPNIEPAYFFWISLTVVFFKINRYLKIFKKGANIFFTLSPDFL